MAMACVGQWEARRRGSTTIGSTFGKTAMFASDSASAGFGILISLSCLTKYMALDSPEPEITCL